MSVHRRDNWLRVGGVDSLRRAASNSVPLAFTFNISTSAAMAEVFSSNEDYSPSFCYFFVYARPHAEDCAEMEMDILADRTDNDIQYDWLLTIDIILPRRSDNFELKTC